MQGRCLLTGFFCKALLYVGEVAVTGLTRKVLRNNCLTPGRFAYNLIAYNEQNRVKSTKNYPIYHAF
ncbi:hypothetical protein C7N43_18085 [Sphingobacteriales bacterium UPWRP_1]|nr:hypothetical protein BVG80_03430 [Sphingobacteriales bacterium TSM_CSM]PSJ75616.1 hypothetical protein C7N43_18085 [Sphingobacteriales bacterium UPWRP_1]